MPLDLKLADRFAALFHNYGAGGPPAVQQLKEKIASKTEVRQDAMYFLLVNLDHMVMQPLSGYIPIMSPSRVGQAMDQYDDPTAAVGKANQALDIILNAASSDDQGQVSANEVARVLVSHAKAIGDVVMWWRE